MREIEVKLQFPDKTINEVLAELTDIRWSDPVAQEDSVYVAQERLGHKVKPGDRICRLRKETKGNKTELTWTMKVQQQSSLDSEEHETTIGDLEAPAAMLRQFGFTDFVHVYKQRRKAVASPYNLCLDYVHHLGVFIEIEYLTNEDVDSTEIQEKMYDWARAQGLGNYVVNTTPYDTQIHEYEKSKEV